MLLYPLPVLVIIEGPPPARSLPDGIEGESEDGGRLLAELPDHYIREQ